MCTYLPLLIHLIKVLRMIKVICINEINDIICYVTYKMVFGYNYIMYV